MEAHIVIIHLHLPYLIKYNEFSLTQQVVSKKKYIFLKKSKDNDKVTGYLFGENCGRWYGSFYKPQRSGETGLKGQLGDVCSLTKELLVSKWSALRHDHTALIKQSTKYISSRFLKKKLQSLTQRKRTF